jgi:phospholipid N-methyltransferase
MYSLLYKKQVLLKNKISTTRVYLFRNRHLTPFHLKKTSFISEAVKNMKSVGALAPSSKYLVSKMLKQIDFSKKITILELGPGTGVVTKQILSKITLDSNLVCLELNEQFCAKLEGFKDKNLQVIQGSAEDVATLFKNKSFDYVVSGLPLAIFKKECVNEILEGCVASLKEEGKYIQFQYSLASRKTLQRYFSKVDVSLAAVNLPPAVVYTCSL